MISKIKIVKIILLVVLGPLLFYPFVFCPFRLPYLYCSICYLKCPWGRLRWFLLLGMLGLNLKRRFYCSSLCPCGTIQDLQRGIKIKKFILPSWGHWVRFFIFGLVFLFILATREYFSFIIGGYIFWFLIGLIFVLSFFSHRFWCLIFCPIGTLTDIMLRIKRWFRRR
ncbi:hypothetical protein B9J78_01375 [bacterium Unc6]|nr:hypothetical protein [bacterium Unc6]